jgi:hypothetical protein
MDKDRGIEPVLICPVYNNCIQRHAYRLEDKSGVRERQ